MALKGEREVLEWDIGYTCESATERGVVLVIKTAGSGIALGNSAGKADLLSPSGYAVAGLLMNDVVDVDQTRYHKNFQKDETIKAERCSLMRKGTVTTNMVSGTPNPGDTAYLTTLGKVTPTLSATGGTVATPKVGRFESKVDENGYVKLSVNIPV